MALGQYKIRVVPVLDTASLQSQLGGANVKQGAGKAGTVAGQAYASTFSRAIKERFKYSIANTIIYGTQAAIKDMVQNVKELDAAQVELKKVSDLSGKSLEIYTSRAYEAGEAVAKTGTQIIQASTEFTKQGFNTETALKLSGIASQFQNIADTEIDAATAAKFINSQLKAFGDTEGFKHLSSDAEKATKVIDSVNEVANKFGVGTNDLQMALTKTGAALKGYGNSYSETIGLITAGTEMLPNQASKVARGWRTIGANILKLSQQEETLVAANGKVNISLRDSNGAMRSTYDILTDLHEGVKDQSVAWKDLSQEEQSAISLMLAGKTQTEVFKSTMDNYTQAIKANKAAQESQGSAARENARFLDSIEGKMAMFQSAWEQLSYHIVSSDMIKAFYDLATNAVKALDTIFLAFDKLPGKYSGLIGMLGSLSAIIAGFKFKKILDFFSNFSKVADTSSALANTVSAVANVADAVDDVGDSALTIGNVADAFGEMGEAAANSIVPAGGLAGKFGAILSAAAPLAGVLLAVGGALLYANEQYKNSFKGKLESYEKLADDILQLEIEIENLENKEGELTSQEESRLSVLKMQLDILKQQEAVKNKQLTMAFERDAREKMRGKTHMEQGEVVVTREDTTGDKYLQAQQKRIELQKKINHLEEESKKHPLTESQTKDLEKYNRQLDKTFNRESEWLERLIEEHEALANVNYDEMNGEGKGWYDNIHSAFLQAATDVESVREGIANTIDIFGSAQFDSWGIDVTSLQSVDELTSQINEKIKSLGEDEEITLYARDETGVIIDEVKQKKSDLTDSEWELVVNATTTGEYDELQKYINESETEHKDILMKFIPEGQGNVEKEKKKLEKPGETKVTAKGEGFEDLNAQKDELSSDEDSTVYISEQGAEEVGSKKQEAAEDTEGTVQFKESGLPNIFNQKRIASMPTYTSMNYSSRGLTSIKEDAREASKDRTSVITFISSGLDAIKRAASNIAGRNATGKRSGEQGGLSWLGDEGSVQNPKPELVVGEDGAYLAGTQGWEMRYLKASDTVYTYDQTKKLLGNDSIKIASGVPLPMFAKGKTARDKYNDSVSSYNKAKKAYDKDKKNTNKKKAFEDAKKKMEAAKKELEKQQKAFDNELETLKYNTDVKDWTKKTYLDKYAALIRKYGNNLTTEQKRAYYRERDSYNDEAAQENAERLIGLVGIGGSTIASAISNINKAAHLDAEQKKDYRAKAYKASVEYSLKEYKDGKNKRTQILNDIKNYYKERGKYDEEYYKMLDDLREADKELELKRLEELQEKEEDKLSYLKIYAQQQKDYYDNQIKQEKEEAEELEKLVDLQNKLNNAKKTMVRVYREGVGFVYEQDTKAIREAQKALDDFNKSKEKSEAERMADEWQAVIDLFSELEELSEIKELELKLGINDITDLTGGDIGTDIASWSNIIKNIIISTNAYEDIIKRLGDLSGADIDTLLGNVLNGGNHQVSNALIDSIMNNHSFASGTLNAPNGLSLVGEEGAELTWLNKGSAVFSNSISQNLMKWGQYNPAQVLESTGNSQQNQIFNFDKIVLPNVRNAEDFYKELKGLPNMAIQKSALRV